MSDFRRALAAKAAEQRTNLPAESAEKLNTPGSSADFRSLLHAKAAEQAARLDELRAGADKINASTRNLESAYMRAAEKRAQSATQPQWVGTLSENDRLRLKNELSRYQPQNQNGATGETTPKSLAAQSEGIAAILNPAADAIRREYESRYAHYAEIPKAADFEEKSAYKSTKNGKEAEWNYLANTYNQTGFDDILYDYINGDKDAQERQFRLDQSAGGYGSSFADTHSGWANLPEDVVKTFNYIYATEGKDAAYSYINEAADKGMTGMSALALNFLNSTGVFSAGAAAEKGANILSGKANEPSKFASEMLTEVARAQKQHPTASKVGSVAGTLALMTNIGKGVGAIPGFASLPGIAQSVLSGAASMGGTTAIQELGGALAGMQDWKDYGINVLTSAGAGAASGGVARGVGAAGNALLQRLGLTQNMFARTVAAGFAGAGGAAARSGVRQGSAVLRGGEFDSDELLEEALVGFAFSSISYLTRNFTASPKSAAAQDEGEMLAKKYFKGMTQEQAKVEYRRLARIYHPDLHMNDTAEGKAAAEAMMKELNTAWSWMNATSGAQFYQNMQTAARSGDTAGYQSAKSGFDESVTAIAELNSSGALQGQEAQDAVAILEAISKGGVTAPTAGGAPSLPSIGTSSAEINALTETAPDAKYSIKYDEMNTPYVEIDRDILAGVPRSEWVRTVKNNMREKFPNGVTVGNNEIKINAQSRREMTFSRYMQQLMRTDPELFANKLRATDNADEILKASRNYVNEALMHPRNDSIGQFARGEVQLRVGENDYTAQVVVAARPSGELMLYDIINLESTNINENRRTDSDYTAIPHNEVGSRQSESASTDSISNSGENVNMPRENNIVEGGLANGQQTEGERVLFGSGERYDGASAGEQTGRVAEGSGRGKARSVQAVTAANRQSAVATRGLSRISARDAGIARGTTEAWMTVMPADIVAADSELSAIYEKNRADGYETRFFTGRAALADGTVVEGWLNSSTDEIWIQADSRREESTATKINEHERAHIQMSRPGMKEHIAGQVIEKYGKERLGSMIAAYDEAYHTLNEPQSFSEAIESQWLGYTTHEMNVIEEILADAYAGRNRFGAHANEMQADVASAMSDYAAPRSPAKTNAAATDRRTAPPNAVAYSIEYDADGTPYVVIDEDILAGVPRSEWVRTVKDNMREKFPNGVTVGNNEIEINHQSHHEMTYSRYMQQLMKNDPAMFADKLRATNNADEIIRASRNYVNEALMHPRKDNIEQFARGEVQMRVGANDYAAQVVVAMRSNGKLLLYDIINLTPTEISAQNKKSNAAISKNPSPGTERNTASGFSTPIISEAGEDVNAKFSRSAESIRYSISPEFASDIDAWSRAGRPAGESFVLGSTGEVLQGLGAIESDIYMLGDKISTIMNEHPEITLDEIKRIPEVLDDPVLILKSKGTNLRGKNTRMIIYGSVKAQNGQPMLAVLDLRPVEKGFRIDDMQKVTSAYTRDNPTSLVTSSEVMYADEKRTAPLLRSIGLAITSRPLLRSGSIGSISYSGTDVNLTGEKFSDVVRVGEAGNTKFSLSQQNIEDTRLEAYGKPEQMHILRAERELANDVLHNLGLDRKTADNPELMEAIRDLTVEIANNGTLSEEGLQTAFEVAFDRTLVDDPEHDGDPELLRYLRSQPVRIDAEDSSDIPGYDSFNEFRQKALGVMSLSNKKGIPVDMLYDELCDSYPQYFSKDITHPAEQLAKIYEVAKEVQPKKIRFGDIYDYNRDAAYSDFVRAVKKFEAEVSGIGKLPQSQSSLEKRQAAVAATPKSTVNRPFAEEVARQLQNTMEGRDNAATAEQTASAQPEINPELAKILTKEEYAQVEQYVQERAKRRAENDEPTDFEEMKRRAAEAKAERLRAKSRDEFSATPAIDKLGIKIANSAGIYDNVDVLQENAKAARSLRRELRRAELRLHVSDAEKNFASGIASGIYTEEDIPRSMNADKVMELVDYYWAENSFGVDFIAERRRMINNNLAEQASELLRDADTNGDGKMSGMRVMNNRTPERNMLHIFGDEYGAEINKWLFEPVAQNEAERYRFINRMMDEVREFEGQDGRTKRLSKDESALVHQFIEGKAVGEMVAGMEMHAAIEAVAENINNGMDVGDSAKEFGLTTEQRKIAEKYARWLKTQQEIETGKVDSVRIENAAKKYTEQFDMFYAAINDFLVAHGYEPIGFIKGYAPHIQPEENQNLLNKALQSMGLSTDPGRLPTSIAGLTAEFKPNKRWNPFFLTRRGDITEYDIVTAYESYVDYMSDVLYHTDDIMRTRQAVNYLRRTYAPENIRDLAEQAHDIKSADTDAKASFLRANDQLSNTSQLSKEDINKKLDEYADALLGDAKNMTKYANLVMYLDNYANILAGKQSYADRGGEYRGGRKALAWANKAMRTFARAQVAGNISSALNQTAQIPQIIAENGVRHTLEALKDMGVGRIGGDRNAKYKQWMLESDFLVGKMGIDYIARTPGEMVTSALFKPAEIMDGFTSALAVRGRYLKEIAAGKTHSEAMRAADAFGNSVMGSRMKGSKPLAFHSKEVLSQIVHMFQVEAVNQWEHLSQDLPRDFRRIAKTQGKGKAALALGGVLVKTLLIAFMLNRLDEELYGGTPAPYDLLGLSANFIASGEGLTTNEWIRTIIDNVWEKAFGERLFGTDESDEDGEFDLGTATEDTWYNISNDIPFLRNAAGLMGWGDNTLPLPDVKGAIENIADAVKSAGVISPDTGMAIVGAAGELLPGGRQLKKTAQGIETAARGGRYKGYGDNAKLQYPVNTDFWSVVRAMMFGNNGLPETSEYYAGSDRALSAKQTQLYEELIESGMDKDTAYKVFQHYKDMNSKDYYTDAANKTTEFSRWVDAQGYTAEQTEMIKDGLRFYTTIPIEAGKYEKLSDAGLSRDDAYDLTNALAELEPEEGRDTVSDMQRLRLIASFGLSEKDMIEAMGTILGTETTTSGGARSHYALLKEALSDGWTVDEYLDAKEAGLMNDSGYARMTIGREYGISVNQYIYCREAIDEDNEDGSVTQAEAEATISGLLGLTKFQKAALWQMQNKSWSAAKNPFDTVIGERVKKALG